MLLGDILSEIERASAAGGVVALLDDLILLAKVNEAAEYEGINTETYVLAAVRNFEREASGSDWTTLISALAADDRPGTICIKRMVEWAITKDGGA